MDKSFIQRGFKDVNPKTLTKGDVFSFLNRTKMYKVHIIVNKNLHYFDELGLKHCLFLPTYLKKVRSFEPLKNPYS